MNEAPATPLDFIRRIVREDLQQGRVDRVVTRFPPEPNGYLHVGHAKAFSLDFDLAAELGGSCFLRMDDTNPDAEEEHYVEAIRADIRWMGYDWPEAHFRYASDYFEQFHRCACFLIAQGLAYVDHLSSEEVSSYRGSPLQPGMDSPWRNRPSDESQQIFAQMCAGEIVEGGATLRARIDMKHPNVHMRDPVIYRIKKRPHHRQGTRWGVYPMYDFAHPLEDAIEGITHSLCSIEFENHRPFYDWLIDQLAEFLPLRQRPRQYEFARLNLSHTVLSKRYLRQLVEQGLVEGWDDPRMPTLSGMRRRGFPAPALLAFVRAVGLTKTPSMIDVQFLYHHVREQLNRCAPRRMAVLTPLKLIVDNYPAGQSEQFSIEENPEDPAAGKRSVSFSRQLWIEADDFQLDPPKGYFRLSPGSEVRLKGGYFLRCLGADLDPDGQVTAVHCSYDPLSRGGSTPDGRKVKGTIHWLDAASALPAEFLLLDHLFTRPDMTSLAEGENFLDYFNPLSRQQKAGFVEPAALQQGQALQFIRHGYFNQDGDSPRFYRVVSLKDSWQKKPA